MKCRLCKGESLTLFYKQGDKSQYHFYKCKNCKLVNLDLNDLDIINNQEKYFFDHKKIVNYENETDAKNSFNFLIKNTLQKANYLDIGCGTGKVLYFAQKAGWDVKGLELADELANYVREKLDIEAYVSDFLKYESDFEQFDVVSLRHVLEHLPDSILALEKISDMLKVGGYAHLEFPNINSISHRTRRILEKTGIHKKKYRSSYQPGHCNEFCRESFVYLLERTNFDLVKWETYSSNPTTDFVYNALGIGTKARAIIKKKPI